MKKVFIILFFSIFSNTLFSQEWINVRKTAPEYSFSMPTTPKIMDTLNIRFAYVKSDSMMVFQVLEFKDTPFDSSNTGFETELTNTGGDTLLAIAQTISLSNNSVITNSLIINTFASYKGLEVRMRYNDLYTGRVLLVYTRFFYNSRTLLSFSVSGAEDDLERLQNNKDQFFSSIAL